MPASSRDGFDGSRMPRRISQTETAMITPMARRTGSGGRAVRISSPSGMPSTRPDASTATAAQSHAAQAVRSLPVAPCGMPQPA